MTGTLAERIEAHREYDLHYMDIEVEHLGRMVDALQQIAWMADASEPLSVRAAAIANAALAPSAPSRSKAPGGQE